HFLIAHSMDERRLDQRRFSPAGDDLFHDPAQIFVVLLGARQRIDAVLHRDGAEPLQPPPDLDAQIARRARDLMQQEEPALLALRCLHLAAPPSVEGARASTLAPGLSSYDPRLSTGSPSARPLP